MSEVLVPRRSHTITAPYRHRVPAGQPVGPAVVLIFGMHRSGTSFLANALAAAGVPFGPNLLSQSVPDNPDGYGEHAEVAEIQETLLRRLGRDWHGKSGSSPLPPGWMSWPDTLEAHDRLTAVVRRELASQPLWAVKDPRTSRLLPLWLDILARARIRALPILCIRDPAEVARSLAERNRMPEEHARAIWLAHQADVLAVFGDTEFPVIDYASFLADTHRILAHTLEAVGVQPDPERLRAGAALAKPQLRHHVAPPGAADGPSARLYADLLATAREPGRRLPVLAASPPGTAAQSRVTIVMRTRDRPLFLARAIRSVLAQTMPGWHLVIVNDGGSSAVVDAVVDPYRAGLGGRFTAVHLPASVGMEAASNCAIRERADPLITIHDDDDSWDPRFLEVCCAELDRTGAAGVVTASALAHERVEGGGIIDGARERFRSEVTAITLAAMARENLFPPIAFVFARAEWEALGGFRASLRVLGDWDYNLRFLARRPIAFIPELLAYWHRRPQTDPFPNTDVSLYRDAEATIRDDLLRAMGDQGLGMISVLAPLLQRAVSDAAELAARSASAGCLTGAAIPAGSGARGNAPPAMPASFTPCRLTPTRLVQVEQCSDGSLSSTGDDPQLHYDLRDATAWPGRYRVRLALQRPAGAGPAELFFSPDPHHAQHRKVFLQEQRPGQYQADFSSKDLVGHLRLDPMEITGEFQAGALTIERLEDQRSPRLPSFLCIGAQRSGTTWLFEQLRSHPALYLPPCKELHFFDEVEGVEPARWAQHRFRFLAGAQSAAGAAPLDRDGAAWRQLEWAARFAGSRHIDLDWYASLFADAPPGTLAGEITPSYALLSERTVKQLVRMIPDLKVIFLMRNPIERAISGAVHELTTVAGSARPPSEAAIAAELATERCAARSSYRQTIERWEGQLAPGGLGCFCYDDIKRDPERLMKRVFDFLGVASNWPVSSRIRLHINNNLVAPPPLGASVMQGLVARHGPEIEWLQQRFGQATATWVDVSRLARAG